jgi:hypothetical protein
MNDENDFWQGGDESQANRPQEGAATSMQQRLHPEYLILLSWIGITALTILLLVPFPAGLFFPQSLWPQSSRQL